MLPAVPAAPLTVATPVFVEDAGTKGQNCCVNVATAGAAPTPCEKFIVAVTTPVTVAFTCAAAVADAEMVRPQMELVLPETPGSVAVVAAVVPVADAEIGVAPEG